MAIANSRGSRNDHWFEGIFQFLFKYRPTEFAKGNFAFGAPFSVVILLLAAAAIGVPAVLSYAGVRGKSSKRDRWVLGGAPRRRARACSSRASSGRCCCSRRRFRSATTSAC